MLRNETIPVFIICFNRIGCLKVLIERLEDMGFGNIHIIDNASSYPPLLEYLGNTRHTVHRMDRNYGHLVLWKSGKFTQYIDHAPYILTDCDVVPTEDCPREITRLLEEILERYPVFTKAGLSIKIDDLPDWYAFKEQVIEWEMPFWQHPLPDGNYEGAVDTTFALYRPGVHCDDPMWWRSIRGGPPLSARHLPWYQNTGVETDEDLYYQKSVSGISSQWSITSPELLKKQNTELQHELGHLKAYYRLLQAEVGGFDSIGWHVKRTMVLIIRAMGLLPLATRLKTMRGGKK